MNTTPSHRLGFLHHIRLVPLFACILGGILVLFALSSALAGYFLWQADRDQRDVTAEIEIRTGLANSSDFLRSARINMIQAGAASRIAEMEAMKRNIAQAESEIKQSQQGYRAYQNRPVKTPADEALDTELNQRFQAYITGMQPMLKYAKNGMFEAIINHESEQIRPLDNAYTDILNKAVKIRSTRANQLAELAHQRTRLGGMFMIGAFVLALVMTLITFMVLRRIVIRPLQHAAQRIEKIASGDLTMNDEPAGRNEIGRLSRHLQQMQHSLGMTIEQRGVALTPKGRQLYDDLLRNAGTGQDNLTHQMHLQETFRTFPDSEFLMRQQGLAWFRYRLTPSGEAHRQAIHPGDDPQPLIERGWVAAQPITYEDFLPVSAAGIFQSNLGNETQARNHGNASREAFEQALGCPVLDEFQLYQEAEERSKRRCGLL
ncbi:DUF1338 family protein [Escherichia coli]|nr:DUF1338 family protein [Escherichia coli]